MSCGIDTKYSCNAINRLTEISHVNSANDLIASYSYKLAADGMRVGVTEKQLHPGVSTLEEHNITYEYDNLNRLISEDANDEVDDGYSIEYKYDLVGNRTERKVTVNGQTLTTTCTYDPNNDRLIKEVHDGPEYSFIWENQRVYAYADSGGAISHYRLHGSNKNIGQFKAFWMGMPSVWSVYLFRAAMLLLALAFFAPLIVRGYLKLRKLHNTGPPIRLSLWHRCVSVLLAYIMLLGPAGFEQMAIRSPFKRPQSQPL